LFHGINKKAKIAPKVSAATHVIV